MPASLSDSFTLDAQRVSSWASRHTVFKRGPSGSNTEAQLALQGEPALGAGPQADRDGGRGKKGWGTAGRYEGKACGVRELQIDANYK